MKLFYIIMIALALSISPSNIYQPKHKEISQNIENEEVKKAYKLLNDIRKNPKAYSEIAGVDLSGIQARDALVWNETLAKVAQAKAEDMARRNYFAHVDPDGYGTNYKINAAGYKLPDDWCSPISKNYFESIAAGNESGEKSIIQLIYDSGESNDNAGHRQHLLGIDNFWGNCTDIGIGTAKGGTFGYYWCVIIAKHNF